MQGIGLLDLHVAWLQIRTQIIECHVHFNLIHDTEGRIALFTSELVESDLIMLQKNRAGHGQGQGYKF